MEGIENRGPSAESGAENEVRALAKSIEEKSSKEGDLSPTTFVRIMRAVRTFSAFTLASIAALAAAIEVNHMRTRYDIRDEVVDGNRVYEHDDPETTAILNFLSGKADLPDALRIYTDRQNLRDLLSAYGMPIPEEIRTMGREQIRAAAIAASVEMGLPLSEEETDELFQVGISKPEFDQDMYETIWELQRRVGAPRVRFADGDIDPTAQFMQNVAGVGRAFYDPVNNTVYLTPSEGRRTLLDEDTHALQFNEAPHMSYARLALGVLSTLPSAFAGEDKLVGNYAKQYGAPGSLEAEAHGPIREKLLAEFQEVYDKKHETHHPLSEEE